MYYYSHALTVYKVIQQLIYNLALFLSYSSVSIYLFLSLYSSHLVFIKCEVLLVTDIKINLLFVLCLSFIIIQTFYLLLIVTGLSKLTGQRLPMHRIIKPTIQVLGYRKEATGNSPLFFDFTAIHKCLHLCGICRRDIASIWKRVERLMRD